MTVDPSTALFEQNQELRSRCASMGLDNLVLLAGRLEPVSEAVRRMTTQPAVLHQPALDGLIVLERRAREMIFIASSPRLASRRGELADAVASVLTGWSAITFAQAQRRARQRAAESQEQANG